MNLKNNLSVSALSPLLCCMWSLTALPPCRLQAENAKPDVYVPALYDNVWKENPRTEQVRGTCYHESKKTATPGVPAEYATMHTVGSAAVPKCVTKGSMLVMRAKDNAKGKSYVYIAYDWGKDVEKGKAAKKSAKSEKQREEIVIDFCAPKESWPERVDVQIFEYAYPIPFEKLKPEEREKIIEHAKRQIAKLNQ